MNIIIADDEPLALEMTCEAVREVCPKANIYPFSKPSRLLEFAKETRCKIAFLDICKVDALAMKEEDTTSLETLHARDRKSVV